MELAGFLSELEIPLRSRGGLRRCGCEPRADLLIKSIQRSVNFLVNVFDHRSGVRASLERLLLLYQASQKRAEERLIRSKELLAKGLILKEQLDASDRAVVDAKAKVNEVRSQISSIVRSKQQGDVLLGSKPARQANGGVQIVMSWFQENLHDPYSARFVRWSRVEKSFFDDEPYWKVSVRVRAKNAFGAYVLSDMLSIFVGIEFCAFNESILTEATILPIQNHRPERMMY